MKGIITIFGDSLSVNAPSIVDVFVILVVGLPCIAILISLICMIKRNWEVAALLSLYAALFALTFGGIDSIWTILLLVYSVPVCIISVLFSLRNKRLEPQQEETSESVVEENDNSYKLEDKNDDWDFL